MQAFRAFKDLIEKDRVKRVGSSSRSKFYRSALLSGLITQQQLDQAEMALRQDTDGAALVVEAADDLLAAKLVEMECLTLYQVDQLRAGRTKLNLGPYLITDWIGQGGMGQVFKAVHRVMGRESAVKVLPLNKSTPEAIANFSREIRTQAQLDHPNLVRAYDAGHDGNVHYLVTEYVPGTDLRRLIRSQGPLTMQQAANVIRQAALGLHYAHQRGLIHRDVKPGNVLVTPAGVAKVSDLGLSSFVNEAAENPRAGKIVGTADYLSPEQIKTPAEVTSVSDIYCLGCTLYYAVTGKVPFPGGTTGDKARRHCEETPWHPRRFNAEVSEEFVEIIADMMEKEPSQRIPSAEEVALRLEPWACDASSLPSQRMTKSPWLPPPLPATGGEDLEDTDAGSCDGEEAVPGESSSQASQGTESVAAAGQETLPVRSARRPPPLSLAESRTLYLPRSLSRRESVFIALAVSIPTSLLVGAVLGFMLRWLLG